MQLQLQLSSAQLPRASEASERTSQRQKQHQRHRLVDPRAKIERITMLAEKLGADPKVLLGNCIDAEFEEVPTDENGEPW